MVKNKKSSEDKIIGRLEHVDFPEWNISGLEAKIDTGAYTSSLHCHHVEQFDSNGIPMVRFYLLDPDHPEYEQKPYSCRMKSLRKVKSSNGLIEERFSIKTTIRLSAKIYPIELTLADRTNMRYPVLLGRKFIQKRFIVDVSKKFISD